MPKLKRKELPAKVKEFLKEPNDFDYKSYWRSMATQLKTKHWLSDKQVKIVENHLAKLD